MCNNNLFYYIFTLISQKIVIVRSISSTSRIINDHHFLFAMWLNKSLFDSIFSLIPVSTNYDSLKTSPPATISTSIERQSDSLNNPTVNIPSSSNSNNPILKLEEASSDNTNLLIGDTDRTGQDSTRYHLIIFIWILLVDSLKFQLNDKSILRWSKWEQQTPL